MTINQSLARYTRRAAEYKLRDYFRSQKRNPKLLSTDLGWETGDDYLMEVLSDECTDMYESLQQFDDHQKVRCVMRQLKNDDPLLYEILVLRSQQYTWKYIAQALNIPFGTVTTKFSRARPLLKKAFSFD